MEQPVLFAIGINHNTAPIEVRERIYVHTNELPALTAEIKKTADECLVISTCNRTEIYGISNLFTYNSDHYKELLINFKNAGDIVKKEHFFDTVSCIAAHHFFKVASSIDSKIIGDSQILQQVKEAYAASRRNGSAGKILNQLTQRAIKAGKRTRTETEIHKGAVSISLAAVELAMKTFSRISGKTVLIIGAGDTAKLAIECILKKNPGKLLVTNRTRAKAEEMVSSLKKVNDFNCTIIDYSDFRESLKEVDILITSTSSENYILRKEDFPSERKILAIDIALPRDIDPAAGELSNVTLKNIDDLNSIVGSNYEKRLLEAEKVNKIIAEEMYEFLLWYFSLPLIDMIRKTNGIEGSERIEEMRNIRSFLKENIHALHSSMSQNNSGTIEDHIEKHKNLVYMLHKLNTAV
jgi:glutamyl-tRNA reductase